MLSFILPVVSALMLAIVIHNDKHLISRLGIGWGATLIASCGASIVPAVIFGAVDIVDVARLLLEPGKVVVLITSGAATAAAYAFYFRSLQWELGIVGPLMLMSPVWTLIFGLTIGETITLVQFLGMIMIVTGGAVLAWMSEAPDTSFTSELRSAPLVLFLLMLGSTASFGASNVLFKLGGTSAPSVAALSYFFLGLFLSTFVTLMFNGPRSAFREAFGKSSSVRATAWFYTGLNETLNLSAEVLVLIAFLMGTTALVSTVHDGGQPVFVLAISFVLFRFFGVKGEGVFFERRNVLKLSLIIIMLVGFACIMT